MNTTVNIGNYAAQVDPLIIEVSEEQHLLQAVHFFQLSAGLPLAPRVLEPAIVQLYNEWFKFYFGYG